MQSASTLDQALILSVVGVLATCVGGLIWVIKRLFSEIKPAIGLLKTATDRNTKATQSADKYLRQRNGRDNEAHEQLMKGMKTMSKEIADSMATVAAQSVDTVTAHMDGMTHIEHQHVDKQVVQESKVKE